MSSTWIQSRTGGTLLTVMVVLASSGGSALNWSLLRKLRIKTYVRRTVNEAAFIGDSGDLNTAMGVNTSYNLRPNIRLNGLADHTIADYQTFSSTNGRYDQYVTPGASALYIPVREFFIGASYQYVYRASNQPGLNYSQSVIISFVMKPVGLPAPDCCGLLQDQ
jgi:hypothetical protein